MQSVLDMQSVLELRTCDMQSVFELRTCDMQSVFQLRTCDRQHAEKPGDPTVGVLRREVDVL